MSQTATKATWTDPPGGENLTVVAGELGQIYLNFENNVDKSRAFEVRIESDLSSKLVSAEKAQLDVAPWGEDVAVINLTPAEIGSAGTYQFTVEIWCDGSLIDPPGRRTYLLIVTPAPTTAAENEASKNGSEQQQESTDSAVDASAVTVTPPAPAKAKTRIKQEVKRIPAVEEAKAEPEPKVEPKLDDDDLTPFTQSIPTAVSFSEGELGEDVAKPTTSEPPAEPVSEELNIAADQEFINLADGKEIRMRPGEVASLKFLVEDKHPKNPARPNEAFRYVLHVEHELPSNYVDSFLKSQVDVLHGGTGMLVLLLKPDATAQPATYGLRVHVAIAGQTPIAIYRYRVKIQPAAAVYLLTGHKSAEKKGDGSERQSEKAAKCIAFGPFFKRLDFPLTVGIDGNAETAYRLTIRDPEKLGDGKTPSPLEGGARDIFESGNWHYFFDRELGELKSNVANRRPDPQHHEFRVRRKGIWWAGLWEKHQVTAAAVPVTDPTNDRKADNLVVLKGIRWRVLPFPWFISVPLLLLLIWFSGLFNAPVPIVSNAIATGPFTVVLGETAASNTANASAVVKFQEESWKYHIERQGSPSVKLSNLEDILSLGEPDNSFVYNSKDPFATSDPLTVHVLSPRYAGLVISDENGNHWNPVKRTAQEFGHDAYDLTVSSTRTSHVVFTVETGYKLAFYTIHHPKDLQNPNGDTNSISSSGIQPFVLTPGPACAGDTWDIVTSDSVYTIIHIHFNSDGPSSASSSGAQTDRTSTAGQYPSDHNVVPRPSADQINGMSVDKAWYALYSILMTYGFEDFSGVPQTVKVRLQDEAKNSTWFKPNPNLTSSMLNSKGLLSSRDFEEAQKLIAKIGGNRGGQ